MRLEHSFRVPVSVDEAWAVLLDIERIAPCMPGAAIDSVDGDDFTGTVKVRLGPIGLTYKGKASFVEKDVSAHRAVIDARGRDARGNGTAAAKVTATLTAEGDETRVDVLTDLDITGKPAQFGRGVMVDVGNKLIGQFADCLAAKLSEGGDAALPDAEPSVAPTTEAATSSTASDAPATAPADAAEQDSATRDSTPGTADAATDVAAAPHRAAHSADDVEPINLIESAGPAIAKRVAPVLAAIVLVVVIRRLRRR